MVDENRNTEQVWKLRANQLEKEKILERDQKENLKKMIDSPDKENFAVAREVIKVKVEETLSEGLNEGQKKIFTDVLEFFRDPKEQAFVLKGYAGTGKTFLVKRILEYITASYPKRRIAITAPTNKAVQVLRKSSPFDPSNSEDTKFVEADSNFFKNRVVYMTIHKLLGLKEQITSSGEQVFKADGKNKSELKNFKYLIVDEVSMLDDDLCREILEHSDRVKILFMGDPAQIPPVNRADCIPFRDDHEFSFRKGVLTEIMRQKGDNPIVEASFKLRQNLNMSQPIPQLKTQLINGKGIEYLNSETQREWVRPILKEYFRTPEFKDDADYVKVIAWRNKTVDFMNSVIREILYGENPGRYVRGEKLVARTPIFYKSEDPTGPWKDTWNIAHTTSEEMEVIGIKIVSRAMKEGKHGMWCKMYELKVKVWAHEYKNFFHDFIYVMHEDHEEEYRELIAKAKKDAIAARDRKVWVDYYNILKWSADVGYNYAITAHKAQGSTYNNVILIEEDLDYNRRVEERNRIKYTAYSRPTDKLYILRKNF